MLNIKLLAFIIFLTFSSISFGQNENVTIALSDKFYSLDTISTTSPDTATDRIRNLIYNSLVKKNENFEYVGELAKDIRVDYQKLTITFLLQDNVKFHNGQKLTSADVKYTLEALIESNGYKASAFYDSIHPLQKQPHLLSIKTPNPQIRKSLLN